MSPDQLRQALRELNGERTVGFAFANVHTAVGMPSFSVKHAMLIPDEDDHLVKVTDGKSIFVIDAERVAWIQIG